MKKTITVMLNNRFNDAERIIGKFSSTGYKIEKMVFLEEDDISVSQLVIVTDASGKNIENLVARLRQQIRVMSVECVDNDLITDEMLEIAIDS